jgi:hypothetical protein
MVYEKDELKVMRHEIVNVAIDTMNCSLSLDDEHVELLRMELFSAICLSQSTSYL